MSTQFNPIVVGDNLIYSWGRNRATLNQKTRELVVELRAYDEDGNLDKERTHFDATGWTSEQINETLEREIKKIHTI